MNVTMIFRTSISEYLFQLINFRSRENVLSSQVVLESISEDIQPLDKYVSPLYVIQLFEEYCEI